MASSWYLSNFNLLLERQPPESANPFECHVILFSPENLWISLREEAKGLLYRCRTEDSRHIHDYPVLPGSSWLLVERLERSVLYHCQCCSGQFVNGFCFGFGGSLSKPVLIIQYALTIVYTCRMDQLWLNHS